MRTEPHHASTPALLQLLLLVGLLSAAVIRLRGQLLALLLLLALPLAPLKLKQQPLGPDLAHCAAPSQSRGPPLLLLAQPAKTAGDNPRGTLLQLLLTQLHWLQPQLQLLLL